MGLNKNIFALWDKTGVVTFKDSKYFGFRFETMNEYYDALCEYYGKENKDELYEYIVELVNEFVKNNQICNIDIKVLKIEYSFDITSKTTMNLIYEGIGTGHKMTFEHTQDPDYVCPDQNDKYGDCFEDFDYDCVYPVVSMAGNMVKKMFGLHINHYESSVIKDL